MSDTPGLNEYLERPETDGELLPVVDENDCVVRLATRREIHQGRLLHRAVHVVLHDGHGRVLLQRRSDRKDHLPGWWDVSVGGHVGPNEDYPDAAVREIAEEMGIADADPRWIGRQGPSERNGWEFIHIFACKITGEVIPDPDEISAVVWVTLGEYLEMAADPETHGRISPAGDESLRLFMEQV